MENTLLTFQHKMFSCFPQTA